MHPNACLHRIGTLIWDVIFQFESPRTLLVWKLIFLLNLEVCLIKYDASVILPFEPFIEVIINALKALLFGVFLLLVLICIKGIIFWCTPFRPCIIDRYKIYNFLSRDNSWILINVVGPKNLFQEPLSGTDIRL